MTDSAAGRHGWRALAADQMDGCTGFLSLQDDSYDEFWARHHGTEPAL